MPGLGEGESFLSSFTREDETGKEEKTFTWEQLAKYNRRDNAHIAIRNKVYNVSQFVKHHPGGSDQIMLGAGRDATQVFESYHKLSTHKFLERFYVGRLVTHEYPWFPEPSNFYKTLRTRVDNYFKENDIDPKICYWMFARYVTFFISSLMCFAGTIVFQNNWPLAVVSAAMWGITTALVAMTCTHDSSHFAITHKPWVWKVVGYLHDSYQGASMFCWIHQHVMGHHPFTNIDGSDPDIMTAQATSADIRRIKWSQIWLPRYVYQYIYVPILYCVLGLKTRLQDFIIFYIMRNTSIRLAIPSWSQLALFFTGKVIHCLFRFGIPFMFMPIWKLVLFNVIADVVGSYWLALIFQTSHVISEAEWPTPNKDKFVNMDWAEMQVATTQDYATDSWFWNTMTGALNHQTCHHLFPGVIQSHYPKITPIMEQTCREFGIEYHYVNTTTEAIACHINHLKRLGQRREPASLDNKTK